MTHVALQITAQEFDIPDALVAVRVAILKAKFLFRVSESLSVLLYL